MDVDVFADALKSIRKKDSGAQSPAVLQANAKESGAILGTSASGTPTQVPITPSSITANVSLKTGKPKKVVHFPPDDALEQIKWIQKAIYDDDPTFGAAVHGRSLADLQREEGSLLRHKLLEMVDWYTPWPVDCRDAAGESLNVLEREGHERGWSSAEREIQTTRESSTLAALYQGLPPDTPVEPPGLGVPADSVEDTKIMLAGGEIEAFGKASQPSNGFAGAPTGLDGGLGGVNIQALLGGLGTAQGLPDAASGVVAAGDVVAELLSRLQGITAPGLAGLESLLQPQVHAPVDPIAAYMNGYDYSGSAAAAAPNGYGQPSYGDQSTAPQSYGEPDRQERQQSGRRSGGGRGGRGGGNNVPASQNTRRPLCSFFAKGRYVSFPISLVFSNLTTLAFF